MNEKDKRVSKADNTSSLFLARHQDDLTNLFLGSRTGDRVEPELEVVRLFLLAVVQNFQLLFGQMPAAGDPQAENFAASGAHFRALRLKTLHHSEFKHLG